MPKLDKFGWASVLGTAGKKWANDAVDQPLIAAGMAADPNIEPYKAIFAEPTKSVQRVLDGGTAARHEDNGLDEFMVTHTLMMTGQLALDAELSISINWLVDTLIETAALGIALQDVLPRDAVVAGVAPFVDAMPWLRDHVNAMASETGSPLSAGRPISRFGMFGPGTGLVIAMDEQGWDTDRGPVAHPYDRDYPLGRGDRR